MKILYAVQATGNGHISRAMELIPYLKQYGTVDLFLSGNNSSLPVPYEVKYKSKGLSLYYGASGTLDYRKIWKHNSFVRAIKESKDLPVEQYDLIINDFEFITSQACKRKHKDSIHVGHQASFLSKRVPRPEKSELVGEYLFVNFVKSTHHLGLHFERYDKHILPPMIKQGILQAQPTEGDHYTVYLPAYSVEQLIFCLCQVQGATFHLFHPGVSVIKAYENVILHPVSGKMYNESLISSRGLITGGGFESPAEALYLGKRLLAVPIANHYEQQCNAAALEQLGVMTVLEPKIDALLEKVNEWIATDPTPPGIEYTTPEELVKQIMITDTKSTYDLSKGLPHLPDNRPQWSI